MAVADCIQASFGFPTCRKRAVEVDFSGGAVSSNGGVLLLRAADRGMSAKDLDQALASFNRLQPETARRVLSFFRARAKSPQREIAAQAVAVNA